MSGEVRIVPDAPRHFVAWSPPGTLGVARASQGSANCFFEPSSLDDLAPVKVGDMVSLECTFVRYDKVAQTLVPVLGDCTLK